MPVRDLMRVAQMGIGHVEGMVLSGIDVIYNSLLGVIVVIMFGPNCMDWSSGFGSSLCTCLRWLRRLPCCMALSHLGQLVMEHCRWV